VTGLLRSELRKLTTGRTVLVLTLMGLVLTAAGSSFGLFATDLVGPFTGSARQVADAVAAVGNANVIALIVGILSVTTEFRHGTIGRTLQIAPSRTRVLLAKLVAGVTYALVLVVLALVVAAGMLALAATLNGVGLTWGTEVTRALWQAPVGFALNAMLGVAVGALLRSQVVALTIALVWMFVVESLFVFVLPSVGKYLPFQALAALFVDSSQEAASAGIGMSGFEQLDPGAALAVFLGYVAAACVAAGVRLTRGDV
jgi:ABC-2 type transport system permease protein